MQHQLLPLYQIVKLKLRHLNVVVMIIVLCNTVQVPLVFQGCLCMLDAVRWEEEEKGWFRQEKDAAGA